MSTVGLWITTYSYASDLGTRLLLLVHRYKLCNRVSHVVYYDRLKKNHVANFRIETRRRLYRE